MNTNTEEAHDSKSSKPTSLADSLFDLGMEWAALGLSFGTEALERSSRSLRLAARTLDTVSRSLHERRERTETPSGEVEVVDMPAEDTTPANDESKHAL